MMEPTTITAIANFMGSLGGKVNISGAGTQSLSGQGLFGSTDYIRNKSAIDLGDPQTLAIAALFVVAGVYVARKFLKV